MTTDDAIAIGLRLHPAPRRPAADPLAELADRLMRAVVRSGAIRFGTDRYDDDVTLALSIMREELHQFIAGEKYSAERSIVPTGGHSLAFASLAAECIHRIVTEREGRPCVTQI